MFETVSFRGLSWKLILLTGKGANGGNGVEYRRERKGRRIKIKRKRLPVEFQWVFSQVRLNQWVCFVNRQMVNALIFDAELFAG
jgi:hypothetical protein